MQEVGFDVLFMDGHTEKQMLPKIQYQGKTVVFMADLLPTTGHIPLPYVMGYDTRPLLTIEEKAHFLKEAADQEYFLFLEHDKSIKIPPFSRQSNKKRGAAKRKYFAPKNGVLKYLN